MSAVDASACRADSRLYLDTVRDVEMLNGEEDSGTPTEDSTVQWHSTSMAVASEVDFGLDTAGVLARAGIGDGQPFVLGADGSYDIALNRYFRELDGWGVRSANGVAAYSRDVMLFCRFLHE